MSVRSRKARDTYTTRDSDLSRAIHQSTELAEIASGKSDFLHGEPPSSNFTRSSLSAALRGTIAAGLLSSCLIFFNEGATTRIWFLGLLVVSGLSFFTAWMEERFANEFMDFEKQREKWEVDNYPDGEIQEMLHIYTGYGLSDTDAEVVAKTLAKYPDFWVDHMLLHEIGVVPHRKKDSDDEEKSWLNEFTPHCVFFVAFTAPTLAVLLSGVAIWAWICSVVQCILVFGLKQEQCQWLTISSITGIGMAFLLASTCIVLASRIICYFI